MSPIYDPSQLFLVYTLVVLAVSIVFIVISAFLVVLVEQILLSIAGLSKFF